MKKTTKKSKVGNNKSFLNYIELKEITDLKTLHFTSENYRKNKPKEIILYEYILNNDTKKNKYSWENDGREVILYIEKA